MEYWKKKRREEKTRNRPDDVPYALKPTASHLQKRRVREGLGWVAQPRLIYVCMEQGNVTICHCPNF